MEKKENIMGGNLSSVLILDSDLERSLDYEDYMSYLQGVPSVRPSSSSASSGSEEKKTSARSRQALRQTPIPLVCPWFGSTKPTKKRPSRKGKVR